MTPTPPRRFPMDSGGWESHCRLVVDLEVGMGRTRIEPGDRAVAAPMS